MRKNFDFKIGLKLFESINDITIPYDLTPEFLRKELAPYLPKRVEG